MSADSVPAFADETLAALGWSATLALFAERTATPSGRRVCLAARPDLPSPDEARARAERGREAQAAARAQALPGLAGCTDLDALRASARARTLEGVELRAAAETLARAGALRAWTLGHADRAALHAWVHSAPWPQDLMESIRVAVDPRGRVLDEAHPALARVRVELGNLQEKHRQRLDQIAEDWHARGALRQRAPVRRGDRLVLACRSTGLPRGYGIVHDRSQSGDTMFVEPGPVVELANRVEDARLREKRLENEVLHRLTAELLRAGDRIARVDAMLGEVDLCFAAAQWAEACGGAWPRLVAVDEPMLLARARHPLLLAEHGADGVVPLDLELGKAYDLLVVTGPNTGGKTVVLKTVGLLGCLARCGLPISAAANSRMPLWRGIGADVGDAQSLQSSLSTFSGHLRRLCALLAAAGPGHLMLLDELGTGTDPEEGAALGQALVERFLALGARVIANTHLGALKTFSLGAERAENASMEFDPVSLAPSFRLLVGVPGASHAADVAERLGLEAGVVGRARALAARGGSAERVLVDVGRVRREAELLRNEAEQRAQESEAVAREMADAEARSRERQDLREREAETAARALIAAVEERLEREAGALAGRLRGAEREEFGKLCAAIRADLAASAPAQRWREFVGGLKKGERIWVPKLRERVLVLKVDRPRERVRVRHEGMEIELPWRELTWTDPPPPSESSPAPAS
jgi:DNA mismatch repair protein MutS2